MCSMFRMKELVVLALMVPLVAAAPYPPPSVLGITIGQPFNISECDPSNSDFMFEGTRPCWKKVISGPDHLDTRGIDFPMKIKPQFVQFDATEVKIQDGLVVDIIIPTTGINFQDEAMIDLKAKFGKPKRLLSEHLQNNMGAKFISLIATWKGKDYNVSFEGAPSDINLGIIEISTSEYSSNQARALSRAPHL